MGAISGLLGTAGGASGTGYSAPSSANILNPATVAQANEQYGNAQDALQKQKDFLAAVQAQNGLGNQSSVFNQLQGVANGTGPNPAQAQLAQATGANVANQAALMAGQRGASSNAGLIARQAAMQGANTQQQAAGQAATMQANQSLNAINSMGSIANQQAAQLASATSANTGAVQGEQGIVNSAIAAQNNANVGMQSNVNSSNTALADTTMKGTQNLIGNIAGGVGSALQLAKGGVVAPKKYADGTTNVGAPSVYEPIAPGESPFDQPQAPIAPVAPQAATPGPRSKVGQHMASQTASAAQAPQLQGMAAAGNTIGKALGTGLKSLYNYMGSPSKPAQDGRSMGIGNGPQMTATGGDTGLVAPSDAANKTQMFSTGEVAGGAADAQDEATPQMSPDTAMAAKGGLVKALLSPGERYLPPKEVKDVAEGKKSPMKAGKKVPGKPVVGGAKNSYANDIVPAKLEQGGVVLPRSVTQSKDADKKAQAFVQAVLAKKGR